MEDTLAYQTDGAAIGADIETPIYAVVATPSAHWIWLVVDWRVIRVVAAASKRNARISN